MRSILLAPLALAAVVLFTPTTGQAQTYKWCAYYGGFNSSATNCGFTSYRQCMATVSGIGGYCDINPRYVEPRRAPRRSR